MVDTKPQSQLAPLRFLSLPLRCGCQLHLVMVEMLGLMACPSVSLLLAEEHPPQIPHLGLGVVTLLLALN